jgi:polyribonucleotide nucleotidyltransferase
MSRSIFNVTGNIGDKEIIIESGRMATQASGAVTARCGDTIVFVAATGAPLQREMDYFPLYVDYREKTSAAGKIPGGFFKREGRQTTAEVLASRLIDRSIRPLWPDGYKEDINISAAVLSFDQEHDTDVLSLNAASAALHISDLPFQGPVGAVRIGFIDNELVLNPTHSLRSESRLDLVVAGTHEMVTMVEGEAHEVEEEIIIKAISFAHEYIKKLTALQDELREACGKPKKEFTPPEEDDSVYAEMKEKVGPACREKMCTPGKHERSAALAEVRDAFITEKTDHHRNDNTKDLDEVGKIEVGKIKAAWERIKHEARREIILTGTREDGRKGPDVRDITGEVGLLPQVHGSALFTRGETQALVTVTLGTPRDEQRIDGLLPEYTKKFLLHYNFPSFSVGETWPNRGPKRREFGHGALAERALSPVLPDHDDFPYTLRVVADVLESNGSSSMATVCGGTLALMDAGVPITQPVAGVAMGLVTDGEKSVILTDILGGEDHDGDMDLKVAGTQNGITALQMDVKTAGISTELLQEVLQHANEARTYILREMLTSAELLKPRPEISPYAPRLIKFKIPVDKIGKLIGPSGKMIRKIQEDYEVNIDVEDDGSVVVSGVGAGKAEVAVELIKTMMTDVEVGQTFTGKVVSIKDFGCFIELPNGDEGMCHISELEAGYVKNIDDHVKMGDEMEVKVINIDPMGKIKLSKKAVLIDRGIISPEEAAASRPPRRDRDDRGRERPRRDRGNRGYGR